MAQRGIQAEIVVLGLAILFAFIKLSVRNKTVEPYLVRLKILTRDKLVVVIFIAAALVIGIEGGTIGILTTYLMDLRAFTQVTSMIGLLVFLSGMAIGRSIIGIFAPQEKINQILLTMCGFSVIISSILFFFDFNILTYGVAFLAGLSISTQLPLLLAKAGLIYHEMAGTVLGSIKVAIPIGGILLPFVLSLLIHELWHLIIYLPPVTVIAFILIFATTSTRPEVSEKPPTG